RPTRPSGRVSCRSRAATVPGGAAAGAGAGAGARVVGPGPAVASRPVTDLLARTAELVAVPSVSHQEGALADLVEQRLRALGHLVVERVGDNVVARTELGRGQRLVLAGHLDTVPPDGNAEPRIEGDVLWGVGAADMKGGLAVMLALAEAVPEPAVDVTWVFYVAEEVAAEHNGLRNLLAAVPRHAHDEVVALLHTIWLQPNQEAATAQLHKVADQLALRFPKAAQKLRDACDDVLAYMAFPRAHWRRLHSTNVLERLNRELGRRF